MGFASSAVCFNGRARSPVVGDESESLNPFELVEAGD
jgi:hypothetical protein